jgi:hypothetical protein
MTRIVERTGQFVRLEEHPGHSNQKVHGRHFATMAADTDRWTGTSVNYVGHKPKSGYMIGGVVPSKVVASADYSRAAVRTAITTFYNQHRAILRKPGHYLGVWHDTEGDGRTWIDISQRTGTLSAAKKIGIERGEKAVFSNRTMNSIDIGSTGTVEGEGQ